MCLAKSNRGCLLAVSSLYLQANTVAGSSALALVVINSGADGEDLFRVAATLGGGSEDGEEPKGPEKMPTVSRVRAQDYLRRCYQISSLRKRRLGEAIRSIAQLHRGISRLFGGSRKQRSEAILDCNIL